MSLSQQPAGPRYGPPEPPAPTAQGTGLTTGTAPTATAPPPRSAPPSAPPPSIRPLVALRVVGVAGALVLVLACAGSVVTQFFRRTTELTPLTPPGAVTKVVLDTSNGDLYLHSGVAGQPVKVVAREHRSFSNPRTTPTTSNGVFTVTGRCTGSWLVNGDCSIDLDVTVPPGITLDVTTGNGDVRVEGITGTVAADSGNGDITMSRMSSPNVQATTGSGDIRIVSNAPASITANTGNGDLTLIVPNESTYKVQADTGEGESVIDLESDPTSTHLLDAHTDNGDLTITKPAGRRAGEVRPVPPVIPPAVP